MHIVYTGRHKLHDTDQVYQNGQRFLTEEVPLRAEAILDAARAAQLGPIVEPADHGLDPILAVHNAGFVDFLRSAYTESARVLQAREPVFVNSFAARRSLHKPSSVLGLKGYYAFGDDSPILEGTWEAAYWGAQCALTGADLLQANCQTAYALCRPPGHHAGIDLYGGACYLNNAAIAARYLGAKAAILDIDYHHGNGTQDIFYEDPSVLFCSLHADPDVEYPYYWGGADETGSGAGKGANRNWPLPPGTGDADYLIALDEALAVIGAFQPDVLVVSAGFDIAGGDPWGGFRVTGEGLHAIGRRIAEVAQRMPTLIVQEGGYLIEELGENAVSFLRAFDDSRR